MMMRKEVTGDCFLAISALYFVWEKADGGKAGTWIVKAGAQGFDPIHANDVRDCKKIPDKEIRNYGLACFRWSR
jgi:hypothetical protein